jgi:hypothetical protein
MPPVSGPPVSGPPGSRSEPAPSRSVPATTPEKAVRCPAGGVRFQVGEGDGAMGLRVLGITLVNCGSRSYRLNG